MDFAIQGNFVVACTDNTSLSLLIAFILLRKGAVLTISFEGGYFYIPDSKT
jgi:hypothetical protein